MNVGTLLFDEDMGCVCIFLGYENGNQVKVMYPSGNIYVLCELPFREISQ
jgi:hypothetical protein